MNEAGRHAGREARELGLAAIFTSVLGAPVAWTLHLFASYLILTIGCRTGWAGTTPAILVVTILFAAAAFASGVLAFRRWQRTSGEDRDWRMAISEPRTRDLLWMLGILAAALFGVTILLAGLPPLLVPLCQ